MKEGGGGESVKVGKKRDFSIAFNFWKLVFGNKEKLRLPRNNTSVIIASMRTLDNRFGVFLHKCRT
jgi:hypothetical protein